MDRRLLFPAIAMTAVAQTTSPANAKAEKALRARAEQFYQLELHESYRQAEALVAKDSKDYFYNSGKPKFKDVSVGAIEVTDNGKKAIVHVNVKVELLAPGVGAQVFSAPATSTWKIERGEWYWYFDKESAMMTPFGKMSFGDQKAGGGGNMMDLAGKPSVASIQSGLSVDRQSVNLTADHPDETVTLSNNLPGEVTLSLGSTSIAGVSIELDTNAVKAGGKGVLHIKRVGNAKSSGTIVLTAAPLNKEFDIQVKSE